MARGGYVPDWQRALIALSAAVIMLAVIGVLYWARTIFVPIALAVFLAFVLSPPVVWLQRRGCGRTVAVILTVGLAVLITAGTGALISQQIVGLANELAQPERAEAIKAKV
ncbi:MAG TPA: AI-2E family transporter, partial [Gemmataceae bacterium]|nr:AI-2E family transporter [Gemmataceae bacterium]